MKHLLLATIIATLTLTGLPATVADADETTNPDIQYALATVPGGTQTGPNQVTWPDGTTLTTAGSLTTRSAINCPSGRYCAFDGTSGTGTRLTFNTCPSTNAVAALRQVRSIANARSSGTVTGRNGTTIIATSRPGTTVAISKTIDKVVCV